MFCEAWESQLCDMAVLLREINDVFEGRRGGTASGRRGGEGWVCVMGSRRRGLHTTSRGCFYSLSHAELR